MTNCLCKRINFKEIGHRNSPTGNPVNFLMTLE